VLRFRIECARRRSRVDCQYLPGPRDFRGRGTETRSNRLDLSRMDRKLAPKAKFTRMVGVICNESCIIDCSRNAIKRSCKAHQARRQNEFTAREQERLTRVGAAEICAKVYRTEGKTLNSRRRQSAGIGDGVRCLDQRDCRLAGSQSPRDRRKCLMKTTNAQCRIWLRKSLVRSCWGLSKNSSGAFCSTIRP